MTTLSQFLGSVPVTLSNITYDGTTGKVSSFTAGSVNYTLTYTTSTIVVAGSDGSSRTFTLDGSGRFTGAS